MHRAPAFPKARKGHDAYRETRILATLRGEPVALLVERDDGACTLLRAGIWHAFSGEPEECPSRLDAMNAVEVAVGEALTWSELAHTRGRTERRRYQWYRV